jgi:tRNA(Phe) wybutosine-synthesizing methylase Tyw3
MNYAGMWSTTCAVLKVARCDGLRHSEILSENSSERINCQMQVTSVVEKLTMINERRVSALFKDFLGCTNTRVLDWKEFKKVFIIYSDFIMHFFKNYFFNINAF